jgi:hypothetical protein
MTLLYDGSRCFFREESLARSENVILRLPFACTVEIEGRHRLAPRDGMVIIPARFLKEGVNAVTLRTDSRTVPAEGILREGATVRPAGFPAREVSAALTTLCRSLEKRLSVAEAELALLKADAPSLLFT